MSIVAGLAPWLLGLVMALAPAQPTTGPTSRCTTSGFRIGPPGAPLRVDAFVDPVHATTVATVLELRRLVGEQQGRLGISLHLARSSAADDPRTELVRRWVLAAGLHGALLRALRLVDRHGAERIYGDLVNPQAATDPAQRIGLDPAAVHETMHGCTREGLTRTTDRLTTLLGRRAPSGEPVFSVMDEVIEGDEDLSRLRPTLATAAGHMAKNLRPSPPPPPPELKGVSRALTRPDFDVGILVGGVGLRHRLLLFAKDQDDPSLFLTLPPTLQYRARHPGSLSIQIVARGDSTLTELLRGRLCAADRLGRELEYLRYLAKDANQRRSPTRKEIALLEQLDETAEEHCLPPPEVALPGASVPDGPWLDGTPRSRTDLENLAASLELLEAAHRPLDAPLSPAARPTP